MNLKVNMTNTFKNQFKHVKFYQITGIGRTKISRTHKRVIIVKNKTASLTVENINIEAKIIIKSIIGN